MAARHIDAAVEELMKHHQQQNGAITAGNQVVDQRDDLTIAAQNRAAAAVHTEIGNIANCTDCADIFTDGVAATLTPAPEPVQGASA